MKRLVVLIVTLAVTLVSTPQTQAQESATIQALATVVSALTITGTNNLNFGNVTPGTPKLIDKQTDVGLAGEWTLSGNPTAELTLDFTLPDSLRTASGSAMVVSFGITDASLDDGSGGGQTAPSSILNPLIVETRNIGAGGALTIWIGGQVSPTPAQTGGAYAADIILTVTLTGN